MIDRTIPGPEELGNEIIEFLPRGYDVDDDLTRDSLDQVELAMGVSEDSMESDVDTWIEDLDWLITRSQTEVRTLLLKQRLHSGQPLEGKLFGMTVQITMVPEPPVAPPHDGPDPSGDREPRQPMPSPDSLNVSLEQPA